MNIFFLHKHPVIAAQMQCDKHVVKMVLETAQMLSTAARAQGHDVENDITEPPQCMPDQYKTNDYVTAYRNYYVGDKKRFAKYKNCKPPEFMK